MSQLSNTGSRQGCEHSPIQHLAAFLRDLIIIIELARLKKLGAASRCEIAQQHARLAPLAPCKRHGHLIHQT